VDDSTHGPWYPPRDARESRREAILSFREGFGLPISEEIVDGLLAAADDDAAGSDGMWLLPDERAEFDRRQEEVFDHVAVIQRYLDEHAADDHAGLEIRHVGGGEILVRFARGLDRHAAALRRAFPRPDALRFAQAPRSERELNALAERIFDEVHADPAAGTWLWLSGMDLARGVVVLEAITATPERAAAELAARYGDAVVLEVIAQERETLTAVPWASYTLRGERDLTIYWSTNGFYRLDRVDLEESDARVTATVREWIPAGPVGLPEERRQHHFQLAAPLGTRAVLDGATGEPRPRYRGAIPG
jgi:hypothetical protein